MAQSDTSTVSTAHRWRSALGTTALFAVAIAIVAAAVLVYVFHPRLETVISGSMRPGIQPGDIAVVHPVPVHDLKVGDVIAYLPPHQTLPVLHRIVDINSDGLITQGDANNVADPWGRVAPKDGTVSRLVMTIPKLGLVMQNRSALFIGAGLLLVAALGLFVFGRKKDAASETPADCDPDADAAVVSEASPTASDTTVSVPDRAPAEDVEPEVVPESAPKAAPDPTDPNHHHGSTQPTER